MLVELSTVPICKGHSWEKNDCVENVRTHTLTKQKKALRSPHTNDDIRIDRKTGNKDPNLSLDTIMLSAYNNTSVLFQGRREKENCGRYHLKHTGKITSEYVKKKIVRIYNNCKQSYRTKVR